MPEERWDVLRRERVLQHPFVTVDMEQVRLPDQRVIPNWPIVNMRNYINALVLNRGGQAMIISGYKHGLGRSSWQVLGGYIEDGEDPLAAAQRELLEETGYHSDDWQRLGSFVIDANRHGGIGHFFLARDARPIAKPDHNDLEQFVVRWVAIDELKQALADGRVAIISYAINISLGLLALGC
ncbi:MAG: NUDIX hydrolase [Anaerolineae bacterium]